MQIEKKLFVTFVFRHLWLVVFVVVSENEQENFENATPSELKKQTILAPFPSFVDKKLPRTEILGRQRAQTLPSTLRLLNLRRKIVTLCGLGGFPGAIASGSDRRWM